MRPFDRKINKNYNNFLLVCGTLPKMRKIANFLLALSRAMHTPCIVNNVKRFVYFHFT